MPRIGPISRRELIAAMRQVGFAGPQPGGRHEFMKRGAARVPLPNPHGREISRPLLISILREANISKEEWESI